MHPNMPNSNLASQRLWHKGAAAALLMAGMYASSAYAAGFTHHVIQTASGTGSRDRQFSYYVPNNYVAGTVAPLWVVLHGCRITERTMTDLVGIESFAERDRAIVLYPFQNNDASSNDNDGRNPNCWGYWYDANIHRDAGEVYDIKRMVDYMKGRYAIDSNRVHITGISSGGAMSTIAQVAYPDVFASAVIVEGVGYGETSATYTGTTDCQTVLKYNLGTVQATSTAISKMRTEMQKSTLRQPPVLVMHNKQDCTVPIKVGQSIIDAFLGLRSADGLGISTTPTSSVAGSTDGMPYTWSKYGNDGNGNSLLESIILDASEAQLRNAGVVDMTSDVYDAASNTVVKEDIKRGHWWSGAAQRGPWVINKGISAGQVAADFFKAHPMRPGTTAVTTSTAGVTTSTTGTTTSTTSGSSSSTNATTSTSTSTTTTSTTSTTLAPGACYNASNYSHVAAGRAYNSSGYAKANGSNQSMGLNNTFYSSKLRQTATNYYVIDSTCP